MNKFDRNLQLKIRRYKLQYFDPIFARCWTTRFFFQGDIKFTVAESIDYRSCFERMQQYYKSSFSHLIQLWKIRLISFAMFSFPLCYLEKYSRSTRCIPIKLLVTTFNNSNNLLELSFHAYEINPDPNPYPYLNRDNPNYLLDTIILLGYNIRIEWKVIAIKPKCMYFHIQIAKYVG